MTGSVLSDALLRHLMAVGQVDILVGIPTFNNSGTVAGVLEAVHVGLAKHFPRERTLTLVSDGGSEDDTVDIVHNFQAPDALAGPTLRTMHRITTPTEGIPGTLGGLKTLLAAGELLQAKAIVVIDPDVTTIQPDWVRRLALPAFRENVDFVAPAYTRHPLDGMLVTQLIRPLFRATYGRRLLEPVCAEFACSGKFTAHCLEHEAWNSGLPTLANVWLPATAVTGGFNVCQAHLGVREFSHHGVGPGLPRIFQEIVGSVFAALDWHADFWRGMTSSEPVEVRGVPELPETPTTEINPSLLAESFRSGTRDLLPMLKHLLTASTHDELRRAASQRRKRLHLSDALWAAVVYEFTAGYHRRILDRHHLTHALVPIYLGRSASLLFEHAPSPVQKANDALEALCLEYERSKRHLIDCWDGRA